MSTRRVDNFLARLLLPPGSGYFAHKSRAALPTRKTLQLTRSLHTASEAIRPADPQTPISMDEALVFPLGRSAQGRAAIGTHLPAQLDAAGDVHIDPDAGVARGRARL